MAMHEEALLAMGSGVLTRVLSCVKREIIVFQGYSQHRSVQFCIIGDPSADLSLGGFKLHLNLYLCLWILCTPAIILHVCQRERKHIGAAAS